MANLLDVNVLIALFDPDHARHEQVGQWFQAQAIEGWATCAITQNGFVRVVSQPGYTNPISVAEAVRRLGHATASQRHQFWPCDIAIVDDARIDANRLLGPMQITDSYLLALAAAHQGTFVTLDQRTNRSSVRGARPEHLLVL